MPGSRVTFALSIASVIIGVFALKHHRPPRFLHAPTQRMATLAKQKPAPEHIVEIDELPRVALRRLMPEELTPELIQKADDLIWNHDAPLGTEVLTEADGKPFVARFEQHYHPVGGPQHPWGAHKGITLYAAE